MSTYYLNTNINEVSTCLKVNINQVPIANQSLITDLWLPRFLNSQQKKSQHFCFASNGGITYKPAGLIKPTTIIMTIRYMGVATRDAGKFLVLCKCSKHMPTSRSLNDHFQPLSRNRNYLSPQLRVDWSVNRFCGRRKRTRKVKNTSSVVKKHQQHHHSFCRSATFVLVPFATRRSLLQFDLNGLPINFDLIC